MVAPDLRQKIVEKLDELNDAQAAEVLRLVEAMQGFTQADPYDDPLVGFFDGPVDFSAEDDEEILRRDITARSGWTQKDNLDESDS